MDTRRTQLHAFWRLKRLRELKGLTLEQLAERTGLTKSYLSKVERGISVPSIATALKFAEAFQVSVGELFGVNSQENDYSVVRKNQRKPFNRGGQRAGYRYEAVAPGLTHGFFDAFVVSAPLKEPAGMQRSQHRGQEMIFVLKGKVEMLFPHSTVTLAAGDCMVFNGQLPHRVLSKGPQRAESLVIVTNEKKESA